MPRPECFTYEVNRRRSVVMLYRGKTRVATRYFDASAQNPERVAEEMARDWLIDYRAEAQVNPRSEIILGLHI